MYSSSLNETDKRLFAEARNEKGLDGEIALMRIIIKSLVANDPENSRRLFKAFDVIGRLMVARQKVSGDNFESMKTAMRNVYRDVAVPILGDRYPDA